MVKKYLLFLAPLLLALAACGDDEPDDGGNSGSYDIDEPSVVEEEPYATLQNSDGTAYTLHFDCVRLRDANNKVVAECNFTVPEPIVVNLGYGETVTYNYYPTQFYATEQSLIVLFSIMDWGITISDLDEPDLAFVYSRDLSEVQKKEICHGLFFLQHDNEVDILDCNEDLFIYSPTLDLVAQLNSPDINCEIQVNHSNSAAFAKVDGKYYLFTTKNLKSPYLSDAAILNYSDAIFIDVNLPYESEITAKFFADEANAPRLQNMALEFSDGNFEANFNFLKYSGEQVTVSYIYDVNGNQISPEPDPEPERFYVECISFSNISFSVSDTSLSDFTEKEVTVQLPYGASMTVCAYHSVNGRNIEIPFEVYTSESSLLTILKYTSRVECGTTTFTLTPYGAGETDIVFSSPEIGEIERWHCIIRDSGSLSR